MLALLVAVLGGYLEGWTWTGPRGKTAWDWLHLVVVPFASVAGLPSLVRLANRRLLDEAELAAYRAGVADGAARDP